MLAHWARALYLSLGDQLRCLLTIPVFTREMAALSECHWFSLAEYVVGYTNLIRTHRRIVAINWSL